MPQEKLCIICPLSRRDDAMSQLTVGGVLQMGLAPSANRTVGFTVKEQGTPGEYREGKAPATHVLGSGFVETAVAVNFAANLSNVIVRNTEADVTEQDCDDVRTGGFILLVKSLWQNEVGPPAVTGASALAADDRIGIYTLPEE